MFILVISYINFIFIYIYIYMHFPLDNYPILDSYLWTVTLDFYPSLVGHLPSSLVGHLPHYLGKLISEG